MTGVDVQRDLRRRQVRPGHEVLQVLSGWPLREVALPVPQPARPSPAAAAAARQCRSASAAAAASSLRSSGTSPGSQRAHAASLRAAILGQKAHYHVKNARNPEHRLPSGAGGQADCYTQLSQLILTAADLDSADPWRRGPERRSTAHCSARRWRSRSRSCAPCRPRSATSWSSRRRPPRTDLGGAVPARVDGSAAAPVPRRRGGEVGGLAGPVLGEGAVGRVALLDDPVEQQRLRVRTPRSTARCPSRRTSGRRASSWALPIAPASSSSPGWMYCFCSATCMSCSST